jgi:hypothetical protein
MRHGRRTCVCLVIWRPKFKPLVVAQQAADGKHACPHMAVRVVTNQLPIPDMDTSEQEMNQDLVISMSVTQGLLTLKSPDLNLQQTPPPAGREGQDSPDGLFPKMKRQMRDHQSKNPSARIISRVAIVIMSYHPDHGRRPQSRSMVVC